ncbi:MAG: restriction endonuclease subunit S [Anaerolineaceae bacterium]|nr:restriction endonuclease subunit S [Anaerolineaceae bacterium]
MNAQQLKNSILQMAVSGKLVPQDPEDEPASVLLERIRAEKEELIRSGKIKREKNPSAIFRGPDGNFYEKISGREPVNITDELPFDIPDSWEWCRISSILSINPRNQLPDDITVGFMPMSLLDDGFSNHHSFENRKWKDVKSGFTHFRNEDVVIAKITPCFQNRKSAVMANLPNGFGAGTTELHVLRDETNNLKMKYILLCCKTQAFISEGVKCFTGTAGQQRVGKDFIANYLIPLPPYGEQVRIVSKIQELNEPLSRYETAEMIEKKLNNSFPILLKKSILQQAVQGKLVPQDPNEEPAGVLLERIRAEKEELIKAGKIKREKNPSAIFRGPDGTFFEKIGSRDPVNITDELPFDIPDSWEWCRISSLLSVNPRNQLPDDTIVGFMPMPLLEDGFSNHHSFESRKWKDVKSGFTHFRNRDVVIAKITPCFQNRKSAVMSDLPNGHGAGTTELHVLRDETNELNMEYILFCCKTQAFISGGVECFTGTAGQQRVGKDYIANYLIPVPPKSEQLRITQAINAAFETMRSLC